jgi:hypothetical protein
MLLAKQPTMGNVRWEVMFKNRSRIVALPASAEKLHGERANVIVFEEFFAYPEELHNRTVKPMLAVQSNRSVANKALYVTSADFQFRWAYQRRAAIAAQARAKDPRYAFMSYKITDMPSPERGGFYSLDQLEDDRMNMPPEIYKQQYYNVWLTDAGTFYVLSVLMNKDLRRTEAVLKGDATKQYVMGIDVARSLRSAGDDSAIAIWEVGESDSLVNIQAYNNITIETLGNEVMRFMDMFPTTNRIVLDYGGGGVHLRDELYKKGIVEIEEFNPAVPGRRILQRFPNTPEEITHAHYQFRGGFETRKLSVPDVPDDGDEAKELVCKAVDDTLKQMANIEATPLASGFFKFDVPNGQKKDLAYAAMYGHWGCQLLKERKRQEDAAAKISDISDLLDPMAELGFF